MRAIVQDYLDKPTDKLWDQMTTEEQRHVAKVDPPKKSKAKKKAKGEEPQEPQEAES